MAVDQWKEASVTDSEEEEEEALPGRLDPELEAFRRRLEGLL
jgi:hypothetical protein